MKKITHANFANLMIIKYNYYGLQTSKISKIVHILKGNINNSDLQPNSKWKNFASSEYIHLFVEKLADI